MAVWRRDRLERLCRLQRIRDARVRQLQVRVRAINRGKCPITLLNLPDRLFKQHCWFDKITVRRITSYLHRFLVKPNNRGSPLSPEDLVDTALLQLSGASFQCSVALEAGGISQSTARSATIRVVSALVRIRKEWIWFPNEPEMLDTALRLE